MSAIFLQVWFYIKIVLSIAGFGIPRKCITKTSLPVTNEREWIRNFAKVDQNNSIIIYYQDDKICSSALKNCTGLSAALSSLALFVTFTTTLSLLLWYIKLFIKIPLKSNLKCKKRNLCRTKSRKIFFMLFPNYRTRAIITRGLYTFYPLFEVQKRFFKGLFS